MDSRVAPLMGACHAMVQRILLEVAGVIPVAPGTTQFGEIMNPPAQLDITPMFADDSIIAGVDTEVLRVLENWKNIMPSLGLRFSRLEAIPAACLDTLVDVSTFQGLGRSVNLSKTAIVMKSPIGSDTFSSGVVGKRVDESMHILEQIARLPNTHCALYLLRYQVARMEYTKRTTPLWSCRESLQRFDNGIRQALERIWGRDLSEQEWQCRLASAWMGGQLQSEP